jgi:LPXTG-motif cell wall-anchored protein
MTQFARAATVSVAVLVALLGLSIGVAPAQTNYSPPSLQVTPTAVLPGQQYTATGSGCQPPETVTLVLNPGDTVLGATTSDQNGNYSFTSNFPSVAPGVYTITATCGAVVTSTQETVLGTAAAVPVAAAPPPTTALPLPRTGSSDTLPLTRIGLAVVAAGGLVVALARKRRSAVAV